MSASTAIEASAVRQAAAEPASRECLSFRVGAEEFGIDTLCVQEIGGYEPSPRFARADRAVAPAA